jgi:NAD(P)-dependent dehydrogenase (short-subunit alcohol dehydrogenase family)
MALDGKYALITGSSRGIGRGIALALAESGVNVAVHYFQDQGAAIETLGQKQRWNHSLGTSPWLWRSAALL